MPRPLIYSALLLLFALVAKPIFGPFLVRFMVSRPVDLPLDELPDQQAREKFPSAFFKSIHELEALGFSLACHLKSGGIERTGFVLSVLVNRESQTYALITSIASLIPASTRHTVNYVEFSSRFVDGHEIDTSNVSSVTIYYPYPERTAHKIPHLKDLSSLYHVHMYLVRQYGSVPVLPQPGTEAEEIAESLRQSQAKQAELGLFFLDKKTKRYRHTWKSAYRSTWRLLWPLKPILLRQQEQEGRRLATQAGLAG